jgi:hypothetical protein
VFYPVTVIEDGDTSSDIDDEIRKIWEDNELGNDSAYYRWWDEDVETYPALAKYIEDNNITGKILIRYWW